MWVCVTVGVGVIVVVGVIVGVLVRVGVVVGVVVDGGVIVAVKVGVFVGILVGVVYFAVGVKAGVRVVKDNYDFPPGSGFAPPVFPSARGAECSRRLYPKQGVYVSRAV